MRVISTGKTFASIPNYYEFYLKWAERAEKLGCNDSLLEAYRLARLAEEFGQAIIEEDETLEESFCEHEE